MLYESEDGGIVLGVELVQLQKGEDGGGKVGIWMEVEDELPFADVDGDLEFDLWWEIVHPLWGKNIGIIKLNREINFPF